MISAPGIRREVETVVARIKRWLEESGGSLSEAAIVAADPERYLPELFRALDEAGLPCSRSRTRPLSDHPLFRTVRAALLVRMGRKGHGAPSAAQSLHSLGGSPVPRGVGGAAPAVGDAGLGLRPSETARANGRGGRGEGRSRPCSGCWSGWMPSPSASPGRSGLPGSGSGFAGSSRRRRDRNWPGIPICCRFWPRISTLFASWIRSRRSGKPFTAGSAPTGKKSDLPSFVAALTAAAERKPVRGRPGVRGGLRVLEPNQVRGDRYRAVFLLGCAEGVWPRPIREDWLLSDEEANRLRDEAVLLPTTDERRKRQLTSFFLCAAAAEELLVLSWPKADGEGKERLPSPYVEELLRVFTRESIRWREMDASSLLPDDWEGMFLPPPGNGTGRRSVQPHLPCRGGGPGRRGKSPPLAPPLRGRRRRSASSGWNASGRSGSVGTEGLPPTTGCSGTAAFGIGSAADWAGGCGAPPS